MRICRFALSRKNSGSPHYSPTALQQAKQSSVEPKAAGPSAPELPRRRHRRRLGSTASDAKYDSDEHGRLPAFGMQPRMPRYINKEEKAAQ